MEVLKKEFADLPLCYSIGGQISFDVFPKVPPPPVPSDQGSNNSLMLAAWQRVF